jgi:hypothetical protein
VNEQAKNIDIHFFQLVFSLQSAAMLQLGKVASPVSGEVERDIAMAKTTIDLLGMIQKKTEGNLSSEEKSLLDRSLYELQMNYVDETKKDEAETAKPSDSNAPSESPDRDPAESEKGKEE